MPDDKNFETRLVRTLNLSWGSSCIEHGLTLQMTMGEWYLLENNDCV